MRVITLVCLVAVAICVYGEEQKAVYRKRQSQPGRDRSSSVRPAPKKQSEQTGRAATTGGRSVSHRKPAAKSYDSYCDSRTSSSCFRCTNQAYDGEGAPTYFVGDWIADCMDESDEEPRSCTATTSNSHECFACRNPASLGEGVLIQFTCDNFEDCYDGSDERCEHKCNTIDNPECFACTDPLEPGEGVYHDYVCDNRPDCHDGSDEICFDCNYRGYSDCGANENCNFDISIDFVCDGITNCYNDEDETSCFKCIDGYGKIDSDWFCDDFYDCGDESDEDDYKCGRIAVHSQDKCKWTEWEEWSTCSCDSKTQTRKRQCSCDSECSGDPTDTRVCSPQNCQTDPYSAGGCQWKAWSKWSACDNNCGAGKKYRDRLCSCTSGYCGQDSIEEKGCRGNSTCPEEASDGCGTRQGGKLRIVGGTTANQANWPWQAQLLYKNKFLCGGTLYKRKYVISAAHCFKPGREQAEDWQVQLGKQDTYGTAHHTSHVADLIFDNYNDRTFINDIVIMVLSEPVPELDNKVNSICLDKDKRKKFGADSNCYITGFGLTEDEGSVAQYLQEAPVPYITRDVCKQTAYGNGGIESKMICAGYPDMGGIDACQGDSGGPLVCTAPDDKDPSISRWYLAGVTSWGSGCAKVGFPGVYTDVSQYIDWLLSKTP
ncbi:uncharacterized protein [Asterias amurensis]|uniref:uncharacterized protein isoform X1 n=2 Tax=Asterias amurensis TaxID=7602 RepID=UPI003AB73E04